VAIIKATRSKKGILFIDDFGNAYITSIVYLRAMLNNPGKGFLQPNRLPDRISMDRFKPSPMYNPASGKVIKHDEEGYWPPTENNDVIREDDAVSAKTSKDKDEKEQYKDIRVF